MNAAWAAFLDELARWGGAGRTVEFWWRDDDACVPSPALRRLTALSRSTGVPLALAVVPEGAQAALLDPPQRLVTVLQHGVTHRNAAAPGEKKTEFALAEPVDTALLRLQQGRVHLEQLFGAQALGVLVPPWNRISTPGLADLLAGAGYRGLSRFGARPAARAPAGVVQVNTHVDIIDWHGSRGFVGQDAALGQATRHLALRRTARADPDEATGWLTHHAVHDAAAWRFLQQLLESDAVARRVCWRSANELFTTAAA